METQSFLALFLVALVRDIQGRTRKKLQFLQWEMRGWTRMGGQDSTEQWVFPTLPRPWQATLGLPQSSLLILPARQKCQGCWEADSVMSEGSCREQGLQPWCRSAHVSPVWIYKYNEASSVDYQPAIHQPCSTRGRAQVLLGLQNIGLFSSPALGSW